MKYTIYGHNIVRMVTEVEASSYQEALRLAQRSEQEWDSDPDDYSGEVTPVEIYDDSQDMVWSKYTGEGGENPCSTMEPESKPSPQS